METLGVLSAVATAVLGGAVLIRTFLPLKSFEAPVWLALSFPLGMGAIGFVCFILGVLKVPLMFGSVVVALFGILCPLLLVFRRSKPASLPTENKLEKITGWKKAACAVLGAYVFFQTLFVIVRGLNYPVVVYDEIMVIGLKAKVFFYDGGFQALSSLPLPSYPLMMPLDMFWVALNIGRWDDFAVKIIFPFMFVSFITFAYYFLREKIGIFWALLGVALTVSANFFSFHATLAYQDFTLCVMNMTALMLMLICDRRGDLRFLFLAGLFCGLTLTVKLEAAGYVAVSAFMAWTVLGRRRLGLDRKIRGMLFFLLPAVLIYLLHYWFVAHNGLTVAEGRFVIDRSINYGFRLKWITLAFIETIFLDANWNVLWVLLLGGLTLVGSRALKDFEIRFMMTALGLFMALYFFVALFTPSFKGIAGDLFPTVLARVLLHFYPLVPFLIVLLNKKFADRHVQPAR